MWLVRPLGWFVLRLRGFWGRLGLIVGLCPRIVRLIRLVAGLVLGLVFRFIGGLVLPRRRIGLILLSEEMSSADREDQNCHQDCRRPKLQETLLAPKSSVPSRALATR
jgi:hypothetical protein